ncbi:MAG: phage holin family protein [Balneolaceae bacterium]|nr:phage holin family protein [Balneolaceae bacterium]MBO6546582.1 phage holin family protein [Balneolaceae bacterium]MBO6648941.1 phage holin family protein [Balneolaceae bacterium]
MDQLSSRLKQITSELKEYLETRIDLLVLNVGDQISAWVGLSTQKIIGYLILSFGLLFASIALAIYLGDLLQNEALGYLIVSIPLLILGLIFAFAKPFGIANSVQKQLMSGILKAIEEEKPGSKKLKLPEHKEQEKLD